MSAWSTKDVTRREAEDMVRLCRMKKNRDVGSLSDEELLDELNQYAYSEEYTDVVGVLYNYWLKN